MLHLLSSIFLSLVVVCGSIVSGNTTLLYDITHPFSEKSAAAECSAPLNDTDDATEPAYTIVEDQADLPILNPSFSDYKTLKLRLKNGLTAYLISDPHATSSAAALRVGVGAMDCLEHPGLAHFLEHMLFLGTKRFPKTHEYQDLITRHHGFYNASTGDEKTMYYFSIDTAVFDEALDRFSSFFKDPLFNPDGVTKEMQNVHQEFDIGCLNEGWRLIHVLRETANQEHPKTNFPCGNIDTLSKISQETLQEWYHTHYSANIMHLVIYSPLPMDVLTDYAVDYFGEIANIDYERVAFTGPLMKKSLEGTITYVEPLKDHCQMGLLWELPNCMSDAETPSDAAGLLAYVLGYQGEHSLVQQLKDEQWIKDFGVQGNSAVDTDVFTIAIELTREGLDHREQVIEKIFQALASIREQGIPQHIYDDLRKQQIIDYQYPSRQSPENTAKAHVLALPHESLETYPMHTRLLQKFDPEAIQEILSRLTPETCHYMVNARSSLTGVPTDRQEKWMHVPYAIRPIAPETLAAWSQVAAHPDIRVPEPNPFLPDNLTLINGVADKWCEATPKLVLDDARGRIYYTPDTHYCTPEVFWKFGIKTPMVDMSQPETLVLSELYVTALEKELKIGNQAAVAGLDYDIKRVYDGIEVTVSGYSQYADVLLEKILAHITNFSLDQEKFYYHQQILVDKWKNFAFEMPVTHAKELLQSTLSREFTTIAERARILEKMSYQEFVEYTKAIYKKTYIEGLLFGNMTEEQATTVSRQFMQAMAGAPYPVEERNPQETVVLPEGGPFYIERGYEQAGYATILAIQNNPFSIKNHVIQKILHRSLDSRFFDTLRTKQKAGYITGSLQNEVNKQLTMLFVVQSSGLDPQNLRSRFELFIENYLGELPDVLTRESFSDIRQAMLNVYEKPPTHLPAYGEALYAYAFEYEDFDWNKKYIAELKAITYEECLARAHEILGQRNRQRLAVGIRGVAPAMPAVYPYVTVENADALKTLTLTLSPKG